MATEVASDDALVHPTAMRTVALTLADVLLGLVGDDDPRTGLVRGIATALSRAGPGPSRDAIPVDRPAPPPAP